MHAAFVNGTTVSWHRREGRGSRYSIRLPNILRYCVVQIVWSDDREQGEWLLNPRAEWPICRETFLARQWYVWSPHDYQPFSKQSFEQLIAPA